MCGIVAMFSPEQRLAGAPLERALATLEHRGPDGRRHWISPDGAVGLGHARLSIIDLSGGAQPLESEDGQIRAIVNGELYGFERIREDWRRAVTGSAPARTARSSFTSTRNTAHSACNTCAASSRSCCGTPATSASCARAIASASSRSFTPCTPAGSPSRQK